MPPPGGLTADTWPRQTQTPVPGAAKDQKVLGRPVDPKLRGSLTTLISDLTDCLSHLLPLVTDKTNTAVTRALFAWTTETPLKTCPAGAFRDKPDLHTAYVTCGLQGPGASDGSLHTVPRDHTGSWKEACGPPTHQPQDKTKLSPHGTSLGWQHIWVRRLQTYPRVCHAELGGCERPLSVPRALSRPPRKREASGSDEEYTPRRWSLGIVCHFREDIHITEGGYRERHLGSLHQNSTNRP